MEETLDKQEDIELCSSCKYIFTKKDLVKGIYDSCPKCGEWSKIDGTRITTSKIYLK